MKIVIDGGGAVYGRLCSYCAKKALEGEDIIVLNSDKVIITGNKEDTIKKYAKIRDKGGHSLKGPKYSKVTFRMLKRGIRGMLPDHRRGIGKKAFSKIKCYDGIPKEFEGEKMINFKTKKSKYIDLKELSKKL